jgi:diguanylate cyclase (GGDEF)-like protein
MIARDGHVVWVHDEAVLHYDEQGQPVHWIGVMRDITEQKRAEEAEKRERALVHALNETGKNLNSSLDLETVLDRLLEAIARVVPYESASVLLVERGIARIVRTRAYGKNGSSIEASLQQQTEIKKTYVLSQLAQSRRAMVVSDTRSDPEWVAPPNFEHVLSWVGAPLVNRGRVIGFLSLRRTQAGFYQPEHAQNLEIFATQAAIAVDNARLFQQIQEAATKDQLTGVYNRRFFFEQATAAFERAKRFHRPLSLLIWDIDHFKVVNDTYGHIAGDQVLQLVAERSRQNLREVDILGRYGGEEFVAVLGEANSQIAREIAERLCASIKRTSYHVDGNSIDLSVSVGVAEIGDCARLEDMLARADRALYKAKRNGRNRVWIWGKTGQLISKTLVAA